MLTAAVRDLHRCYPNQFLTDVRTPCPALWENNPYRTRLDETDPEVELIECDYPLFHRSNELPVHFLYGFIEFLNEKLGLHIKPTAYKGDIYISDQEKRWWSQVQENIGQDMPFWIIVAGGKTDCTLKWWDISRYQQVVDHFHDKILFVQVGENGHHHPPLRDVLDLRGKTDLRQLVRLMYHAQGVLCPITLSMHLAAAVEVKGGRPRNRPCVVIAGGREPPHWEAYPHHQFLHTVGALPCCEQGGCWRSRAVPLGDGDWRDKPEALCVDTVGNLPRCLHMITAETVIQRIESYYDGGVLRYLTPSQNRVLRSRKSLNGHGSTLTESNSIASMEAAIETIPVYPGNHEDRGIVIPGGGPTHGHAAYVCVRMLRHLGCVLPIELWHLGADEMPDTLRIALEPLGVTCVDADEIRKHRPVRILNGWELKPYAILHSRFREVLHLDADNVPVLDPTFLFDTPQFRQNGAVFWPDRSRLTSNRAIWRLTGVSYRDEPEVEAGQIVVDKQRCWRALCLTMWMNEHSDFWYRHIYGDKDTFYLAWRKLGLDYAMPTRPLEELQGTMCQHDFDGRRIFQHRSYPKWKSNGDNPRVSGFLFEEECLRFLAELKS